MWQQPKNVPMFNQRVLRSIEVVNTIKNLKYLRNLEKWQRSQILFRFEYTPHWVAKPNRTPSTVWTGKLSKFEQMIDGPIVKIFLTQKRKTYTTISDKKFGKNCYLDNFIPFPLLTMSRNNEQNLRQVILSIHNII